jgi:hypothetical protein
VGLTTRTPRLITVGVIAAELHVPLHRVLHVLGTRPHIQPAARAFHQRGHALEVGRLRAATKCR